MRATGGRDACGRRANPARLTPGPAASRGGGANDDTHAAATIAAIFTRLTFCGRLRRGEPAGLRSRPPWAVPCHAASAIMMAAMAHRGTLCASPCGLESDTPSACLWVCVCVLCRHGARCQCFRSRVSRRGPPTSRKPATPRALPVGAPPWEPAACVGPALSKGRRREKGRGFAPTLAPVRVRYGKKNRPTRPRS